MVFLVVGAGILGLIIGSFLTVVVKRIGTDETIVFGRSHCIHCQKILSWYELLPVLSFLAQGGQCRLCHGRIPWVYPAIELITSGLFGLIAWGVLSGAIADPPFVTGHWSLVTGHSFFRSFVFLYYAYFVGTAIAISFYDFLHRLIPNALVAPLAIIGAIATLAGWWQSGDSHYFLISIAVSCCLFLVFWSLWFFSRGLAMGRGDADAAFAIALFLGPLVGLIGSVFAFWIGSILGILLVGAKKLGFKSQIPFAPFLFTGATAALFLAPVILPYFAHLFW